MSLICKAARDSFVKLLLLNFTCRNNVHLRCKVDKLELHLQQRFFAANWWKRVHSHTCQSGSVQLSTLQMKIAGPD